jgi:hypothetical protein
MEVSSDFHVPAALPRGKSPHYPFTRRLDGPLSQSRRFQKKSLAYGGNRTVFSGSCCTYPSHYTHSGVLTPTCMMNDVTFHVLLIDPVCVVAYDTELNGSHTGCFRSRWELLIFLMSSLQRMLTEHMKEGLYICLSAYFIPVILCNRWWILSMWPAPKIVWKI